MALAKMTPGQREGVPERIRIKKNDMVKVIAGSDKGKTGRVLEVIGETGRVLVEHCGMVKRHTRPNPQRADQGRDRRARVSYSCVECDGDDSGRRADAHRNQSGNAGEEDSPDAHCAQERRSARQEVGGANEPWQPD